MDAFKDEKTSKIAVSIVCATALAGLDGSPKYGKVSIG